MLSASKEEVRFMSADEMFKLSAEDIPMKFIIDDYVSFSNENRDQVIEKINTSRETAERQWKNIVKTGAIEELEEFYTASDYHYDVLLPYLHPESFNKGKRYKEIIDFVRDSKGDKVMEFGGGSGQLCLLLYYNTNKDITYVDLPSKIMDFARWRFERYNACIKCIETTIDNCSLPEETYDIVISDAVLEHVLDVGKTVRTICKSLKFGGYFCLFFDDTEKDLSMHISSHMDIDKILRQNHLRRVGGAIWTKKK